MPPLSRQSTSAVPKLSWSPTSSSRRQPLSLIPAPTPPPTTLLIPTTHTPVNPAQALGFPVRFHVVQDSLHVQGYQLYAVEKWIVERRRAVTSLVVYTGNLSHKIYVTALRPLPHLSQSEAQEEWEKALNHLRSDGARPKETSYGVLMTTSLAHFRSDYTIVHIPDGNFLAVREQLYTNINLRRMGCSGRSALSLEEPSDTTKDRFLSTYHLPEIISTTENASPDLLQLPLALTKPGSRSHSRSASVLSFSSPGKRDASELGSSPAGSTMSKTKGLGYHPSQSDSRNLPKNFAPSKSAKDYALFIQTVLELVKLIQAGLAVSGMYKPVPGVSILLHLDGLLCDETVDGIRKWIIEVGDPCVGLEPMERVADPTFVAALLSLIMSIRNKLAFLGFSNFVPKDPFLQPQVFCCALASYVNHGVVPGSTPAQPTSLHSHGSPNGNARGANVLPAYLNHTPPQVTPSSSSHSASLNSLVFLSRELAEAIILAYDNKARLHDGRGAGSGRVRRALRDRLKTGVDSDGDGTGQERGAPSGGEGDRVDKGGLGIAVMERDAERDRDQMGAMGMSPSPSSSSPLFSGLGNLASGFGLGVGGGAGSTALAGPSTLFDGASDMEWFSKTVAGKDRKGKGKMGREKKGDGDTILGVGYAYAYIGREKDKDLGVGISLRSLWGGGLLTLIKLRELEVEREKLEVAFGAEKKRRRGGDRLALSDGDAEDGAATAARSETEEESDNFASGGFGGVWGEKMQRRLESWTGISKRRGHLSLDFSPQISRNAASDLGRRLSPVTPRPTMDRSITTPVSPTLPPNQPGDADLEDDDLLSSGQVSPIADNLQPSPFHLHDTPSKNTLPVNIPEPEPTTSEIVQERSSTGRSNSRKITSWADPFSARVFDCDYTLEKKSKLRESILNPSLLSPELGQLDAGVMEEWSTDNNRYIAPGTRLAMAQAKRRRSFHDLSSLRGIPVLSLERMRIDVDLCGQLLVMHRRERHLQNVVACLHALTLKLTRTSSSLREQYQGYMPRFLTLEERVQVISVIDAENTRADKMSQATHTLRYEAEQFKDRDLWHIATPSRRQVLELREKVSGTGGRRLPMGVHGAHGRFNRLQWTLDGQPRLVDYRWRTESEAEEEEVEKEIVQLREEEEEEDADEVRHSTIKPMWLLHFFTSWGAGRGSTVSRTRKEPDGMPDTNGVPTIFPAQGAANGKVKED